MPRDYTTGKIYRLWSPSANLFYYGSTINTLSRRLVNHRAKYKQYLEGKSKNYMSSFEILKYPDYRIELFEYYSCTSKLELIRKEGEVIRANECVNKCIPYRTNKEYRQDNKEQLKQKKRDYYQKTKHLRKPAIKCE